MKRIKGGKKEFTSLPESVEGADTPEEIADKFKEVYEALYNSADTSEAVGLIKDKLELMIDGKSLDELVTQRTWKWKLYSVELFFIFPQISIEISQILSVRMLKSSANFCRTEPVKISRTPNRTENALPSMELTSQCFLILKKRQMYQLLFTISKICIK